MPSTVIEITDSTLIIRDNDVKYLTETNPDLFCFIQKYPLILKNKFIILKPHEFNLFNVHDFENINSVINLKLINQNPGFIDIFQNICNHLPSNSYYVGLYQSHSQVRRRLYYAKHVFRYFVHVLFILMIGILGVIPFIKDNKYIRDKYFSYSYMSKGLNKLFVREGMYQVDKLITDTTTYFILYKN